MKDILLDTENYDLRIENGDFVVGESLNQEVDLILRLSQGDLKEDPVLGPNLLQLIHANASKTELRQRIKQHLARDRKRYSDLKERINLRT